MSIARTPNNVEGLAAQSDITSQNEYLLSHNGALDVNATVSSIVGSGIATEASLTKLNGFSIPVFDSIYPTYNATSDVYVYKLATVTVATLTVSYTDATKTVMTSIIRT